MKRLKYISTGKLKTHIVFRSFSILLIFSLLNSCQKDGIVLPEAIDNPLTLSVSADTMVLDQRLASNALSFNWTTGSNKGTGASIEYTFQIDKKGNSFTTALSYNLGKAVYTKSFTYAELNNSMLNQWGLEPDAPAILESRVIAVISAPDIKPDTSSVAESRITPYLPVTSELYIFGSATEVGWDIANAIELTPDNQDPTIFKFQGAMYKGTFKFSVNRNTDFAQDMYMRDPASADSSKIYLHKGGGSDDNQWEIIEAGQYQIQVSLLDLTIEITKMQGPAYDVLYIVGDATPIGWDIANAIALVQNPDNLFQFIYDGILVPGDFKFPVNQNTDWGQDFFMRDPNSSDSTKVYLHNGGDSDDNKWTITKKGWYRIVLDISKMTIKIEPLELYIIGSATEVGWNIGQAIPLTQNTDEPYLFVFQGNLGAGEFKFPVNRQSDWGQDMYMKDPEDETKMYRHRGGAADDSKWVLEAGDAGTYILTLNVKDLTIDIAKQ
ncbi:MAG: SusF/SusE family outer membrane protein [Salinivirgaceae bacterium]|nr:SusF/SusE family outer membrane protein [Salinivirgaceae bacterium]